MPGGGGHLQGPKAEKMKTPVRVSSEPGDCGALPGAHWHCGTLQGSEDSAAGVHSCVSLNFVPAIAKDKGLRDIFFPQSRAR